MTAWVLTISFMLSAGLFAESTYVQLFENSHKRSIVGLNRQKARMVLASAEKKRYTSMFEQRVITLHDYETMMAAVTLADLDLRISELREKQAKIAFGIAGLLAQRGRPIPLCSRRKQTDENTTEKYLAELFDRGEKPLREEPKPLPLTKIDIPKEQPVVEPPVVEPPAEEPPPNNPPNPFPTPPEVDPETGTIIPSTPPPFDPS